MRQLAVPAMHPKDLSIRDFTYPLPEDRIAHYPLPSRDDSRLLIYIRGTLTEDRYRNIAAHIPAGSLLVFNNSKVIEARLLFQKPTGGVIELFCLEPAAPYPDITSAMMQQEKVYWKCMVGGASKWKRGQLLEKKIDNNNEELLLSASCIEKRADCFIIGFSWQPAHLSFAEVLHRAGAIPLPPYIKRNAETTDTERYQTIYARHDGSVAAPTAGLHFTDAVFNALEEKNIHSSFVTLHVGAGTFKPVKSDTMEQHDMHAEYIDVSRDTIEAILHHLHHTVIATGTTSLRTIESLYWLGVKCMEERMKDDGKEMTDEEKQSLQDTMLTLDQWEAYDHPQQDIPAARALQALLAWMDAAKTDRLLAKTGIIIAPGYRLRIAKALITNFHQPQSTLLLLIAAITGNRWKKIYDYALDHGFRFLSYGDGCLLWYDES